MEIESTFAISYLKVYSCFVKSAAISKPNTSIELSLIVKVH